jgi:hypothetical protein
MHKQNEQHNQPQAGGITATPQPDYGAAHQHTAKRYYLRKNQTCHHHNQHRHFTLVSCVIAADTRQAPAIIATALYDPNMAAAAGNCDQLWQAPQYSLFALVPRERHHYLRFAALLAY